MSASDRAAALRAQADALDEMAILEAELLAAKQLCAANPSIGARISKQKVAQLLRDARAAARTGRTGAVGGDAYRSGTEA